MSSWSKNRKNLIGTIVALLVIAAIAIPAYMYFYTPPTCFDNAKNGNEQGVDCGGSCEKLCQSAFTPPTVAWTRFEEIAPGLYNAAAYIINLNTEGEAKNVPYHIALYDSKGMLIVDKEGTVDIPPHRNTLAYEGMIEVGKRLPAKALFEFTSPPKWYREVDRLTTITIGSKDYTEDESGSSLSVTLGNESVSPIQGIGVYAVLYDANGNALGFSRTYIDEIEAKGKAIAPFTWPIDRKGAVVSIEVLPVKE